MPKSPRQFYIKSGEWINWSDFLGTEGKCDFYKYGKVKKWDYETAKKWVQENLIPIGINNSTKWNEYMLGLYPDAPKKPDELPVAPDSYYKNKGWIKWNNFLNN